MTVPSLPGPRTPRSLRLWPGVTLAVLMVLGKLGVPYFVPEARPLGVIVSVLGGLGIGLWWLLFSRAPWSERIGALLLMVGSVFAVSRLVHPSIANGMMGMMLPIFAIPVMGLALVAWAAASERWPAEERTAAMVAVTFLAAGLFTTVRTGGISGEGSSDLHWRWTRTSEERLLAEAGPRPVAPKVPTPAEPSSKDAAVAVREPSVPLAPSKAAPPERPGGASSGTAEAQASVWPGFRGPHRDGVIQGVRLDPDWTTTPPVELWRHSIGPGWSSFAVDGDRIFTQEQRGEDEIVACYSLTTGEAIWMHEDRARFWESNGGAGPRGTPFLEDGRVYTLGATGILNALSASDGSLVWSRNAATDTGAKEPGWGFAGSPLVVSGLVVVATSGRLAGYDLATGEPRWYGPKTGGGGYSSPHLASIGGVEQIVLLRGGGALSVSPKDGSVLWEHAWEEGVSIIQPALTAKGEVFIAGADGMGGAGIRRLSVSQGSSGWTASVGWTSRGLKPYFNDFVVHKGHAYGFDGSILSSISLIDGKRNWKGGRYGSGQLVLLADQDLLLVLSEEGDLALVSATSDGFREVTRFKAIEGKTWNHPAMAGNVILVRNGEEMAAFRLPAAVVVAESR